MERREDRFQSEYLEISMVSTLQLNHHKKTSSYIKKHVQLKSTHSFPEILVKNALLLFQ